MRCHRCMLALVALLAAEVAGAGQLHVLPVVAADVPGDNGSRWMTDVRIVAVNPGEDLAVRRAWVALPGSGWEEDPESAVEWRLSDWWDTSWATHAERGFVLTGKQLLDGTGSAVGAVGLEVEGEAVVMATVADVSEPVRREGGHLFVTVPGTGQLVPSLEQPLRGEAYIPWSVGGNDVEDCYRVYDVWRDNLGLVNPSPEPLEMDLWIVVVGPSWPDFVPPEEEIPPEWRKWDPACVKREGEVICPAPLLDAGPGDLKRGYAARVTVPPWGWVQLDRVSLLYEPSDPFGWCLGGRPSGPEIVVLRPVDPEHPYYAYLSLVYGPTNDPRFVPAVPGHFGTWDEVAE